MLRKPLSEKAFSAHLLSILFFKSSEIRQQTVRQGEPAELIVMVEGVYRARTGGKSEHVRRVEAKAGEVVFWPSGSPRMEENDPHLPMRCYSLYLEWPEGPRGEEPFCVNDQQGLIRYLAMHLLAISESRISVPPTIHHAFVNAILAEFTRLLLVPSDPLESKVLAFLNAHRNQPFRLQELARFVGLESHHFSRAFKKRTGFSPMEYVRRRRLEWACSLIQSVPHLQLREIARRVGIRDENELRRQLRRYTSLRMRYLRSMLQKPGAPLPLLRVGGLISNP